MDIISYALSKKYIDKIASTFAGGLRYQGSKPTVADLPAASSSNKGHLYTITENGHEYVSDGTEDYIIYGPNYQFKKGIYDIELEYEVINDGNQDIAGVFDLVKNESEIYSSLAIDKSNNTIGFYDLEMDGSSWIQYRVWENAGVKLKINKVVVRRK